jgi:thioredoxin reductase (NADPH)
MVKIHVPDHVYDVVIIGGGPAGLTAGLYASRAGFRTLLFEGASTVSQITVTDMIENYPGIPEGINGFDLIERFKKQAGHFGLCNRKQTVGRCRGMGDFCRRAVF